MRITALILSATLIAGCTQSWDRLEPSAPPGGTGISADDDIVSGPEAVSSVSLLPSKNGTGVLPPFAQKGEAAAYEYSSGYRVGAGDRLSIRVAGEGDLTGEYVVDASGELSMPYVPSVQVAGKTTREIERLIVQRLSSGYLLDPKVSVQAISLRPFYIMGEVTTGGSYPYQPGMTVQAAIAVAGGYGPRADQSMALVTRRNAKGTQSYKVPLTTQIYPGDIIFVRERWF